MENGKRKMIIALNAVIAILKLIFYERRRKIPAFDLRALLSFAW